MNTNLRRIGSYKDEEDKIIPDIESSEDGWFKELLFDIGIFFKDVKVFILYDLPYGLRNLFKWFRDIWRTRYWDWCFALSLEHRYLKLMLNRYEKNDYFVGQEYMVSRLKLVIKLLEMIENSDELNEDKYVNVGNWKRFLPSSSKFDPDKWHYRVMLREEKIFSLYNKARRQYLRLFWD